MAREQLGAAPTGATDSVTKGYVETSTVTLTNKTLTSPIINTIYEANGKVALNIVGNASGVNYLQIQPSATGAALYLSGLGSDTDVHLNIASKNAGIVSLRANGANVASFSNGASCVNYLWVYGSATGQVPGIVATGSDTNINLNLGGKGTGVVLLNSIAAVDVSSTQTLTNKTLTNPRVYDFYDTNGQICGRFTPNAGTSANYIELRSGIAGQAAHVRAAGETNADLWLVPRGTGGVGIYSATTPAIYAYGPNADHNLNLVGKGTGVVQLNGVAAVDVSSAQSLSNKTITSAKVNNLLDTNGNVILGTSPQTTAVNYLAIQNASSAGWPSINATGTSTDLGIWLQPRGTGWVGIYEPTGMSTATFGAGGNDANVSMNLSTKGTGTVKANGVDVVTTTGTATLTNKTLSSPTLTAPKIAAIYDPVNSVAVISTGSDPAAVNGLYVYAGAAGTGPQVTAHGADANQNLDLVAKGTGVVRANYVPVVTTTGTATLTNKTITSPTLTTPKIDTIKDSNGNTSVSLGAVASAVNYVYIAGAATGSAPSVQASGSDTNISFGLYAKGTGGAFLGSTNGIGFSVTAPVSAVNYMLVSGSATGTSPLLSASGSDANLNLNLSGKGSGTVTVNSVPVVTTTGTATLTNKTIAAGSNTITGLTQDAVTDGTTYKQYSATEKTKLASLALNPRIGTTASSATPSINCDLYDHYTITALAAAITGVTITGTPTDGQKLMVRIKDNATPRTITWGASFVSGPGTLLTTTAASKTHLVGLIYDSAAAKWVCVAADSTGY